MRIPVKNSALEVLQFGVRASVTALLVISWADPDLWGHVRFGSDIIGNGLSPVRVDPYSFTSDVPWVNHEWLAEAAMSFVYSRGGGAGLVTLKAALVLGAVAISMRAVRAATGDVVLRDALLVVLTGGIWIRSYVIRPQVFSLLAFAILICILRAVDSGRKGRLLALPPLFGVWANLHGGWIVGFGVLALWAALTATTAKTPSRRILTAVLLASAAATLMNPFGVGMWQFLVETVRVSRPQVDDWRPLTDTPALLMLWVPVAAVACAGLVKGWRTVRPSHAAIVTVLGLASLRVSRIDAFFALAAIPLLAPQLATLRTRVAQQPHESRISLLTPVGAVVVLAVVLLLYRQPAALSCVRMDRLAWLPEPEALMYLKAASPRGRLLTWFGWGHYAIWHLSPDLKVSFDGRRETVYSEGFIAAHFALYSDPAANRSVLAELRPDYAWLPRDLPLVAALQQLGWHTLYSGPASVVLSWHDAPAIPPRPTTAMMPRCFPGP